MEEVEILCEACGIFFPALFAAEHLASQEHNNSFQNLFVETESAAKCRLVTLSAGNPSGILGVEEYLESVRGNVLYWLKHYQNIHKSLKYNMVLECKFYKNEEHQLRAFKTQNAVVYLLTNINEQYSQDVRKMLNEKHDLEQRGSGWSLFSVDRLELRINKYEPMTGGKVSSRFQIPTFLKKKKCIVNPFPFNKTSNSQCCENQCFKFAIIGKLLFEAGIDINNIRNYYRYLYIINRYNWNCIEFPVAIDSVEIFEMHNSISINIYGVDTHSNRVYPIKVTMDRKTDHRDILYFKNHFCWIKKFESLFTSQVLRRKRVHLYVCRQCFQRFYKKELLLEHEKTCRVNEGVKPFQTLHLAEKSIYFKNYNRQLKIPYVIYADVVEKLKLQSTCVPDPSTSYVHSVGVYEPEKFIYCVSFNGKFEKRKEFSNVTSFMRSIENECKHISEIYKINIPVLGYPLRRPNFNDLCHICEKPLENDFVFDHNHLDGLGRGFAHSVCNLNYRLPSFVPIIMKNFTKHNSALILQYFLQKYTEKKNINIIPCNENVNKCMSLSYFVSGVKIKFLDQCSFVEPDEKLDFIANVKRFERVRNICYDNYKLDLAYYLSVGAFSWDAMLRVTKVELELLNDVEMHRMVGRGIRGGLVQVVKRYAYANNETNNSVMYKPEEPESHIFYFDIINLYGKVMLDFALPHCEFSWVDEPEKIDPLHYETGVGYIFEVDLEYPESLIAEHLDYPLCPHTVEGRGLVASFHEKLNYVVHHTMLRTALQMGIVLKKIHRAIRFKESSWLYPYINLNTMLRTKYCNDKFLSDFFKLQSNIIYGKSIERIENRLNVYVLKSNETKLMKLIKQPNFYDRTIVNENTYIVYTYKRRFKISKPTAVGMSILDISKSYMYDLYYNQLKMRLPPFELLYTDTDAILIQIYCRGDILKCILKECVGVFYLQDGIGPIGMLRDESLKNPIVEYVGLRCKVYGYRCAYENRLVLKNLPKCVEFSRYIKLLTNEEKTKTLNNYKRLIGDKTHEISVSKNLPIVSEDQKRFVCSDRIHTLPIFV